MLHFLKLSEVNNHKLIFERKARKIYRIGSNFNLIIEDIGGVLRCRVTRFVCFNFSPLQVDAAVETFKERTPPIEVCKIRKQNTKWYMYSKSDLDYFWECVDDAVKWYERKDRQLIVSGSGNLSNIKKF